MSISQLKTLMSSTYIIQRFFYASGFKLNKHLNIKQIKFFLTLRELQFNNKSIF